MLTQKMIQFLTGSYSREAALREAVKYPEVLCEMLNRLRAGEADEGRYLLDAYAETLPPKYAARLRQHSADEARHAQLFEDMLIRYGGTPQPVTGETFMTEFQRLSGRSRDDMPTLEELLAGLYQIECRAWMGMTMFMEALEPGHPVRELLQEVRKDEERHIRWVADTLQFLASTSPERAATIDRLSKRFAAVDKAAFLALTGTRRERVKALFEIARNLDQEEKSRFIWNHVPRAALGFDSAVRKLFLVRMVLKLRRKYHGVPPGTTVAVAA
ncbi:MAG: ferritin-like domain-containing protein [Blastocatellia bacterium]|nr:ferritin-like domain-containing protein [Blastocatellia bacterium]